MGTAVRLGTTSQATPQQSAEVTILEDRSRGAKAARALEAATARTPSSKQARLNQIIREAIILGATIEELQETAIREALFHYCNISRAAEELEWSRPAIVKRAEYIERVEGITVADMRKLKHAQRSLPFKAGT